MFSQQNIYLRQLHPYIIVESKKRKGKCRDFTCSSKADKISLVYRTNQTKKMKRAKQKANWEAIELSQEMVIKSMRFIRKGEGDYGGKDVWKM